MRQVANCNHVDKTMPKCLSQETREPEMPVTNTWLFLADGANLFLFVAAAPTIKSSWSGTKESVCFHFGVRES